MKTPVSFRMCRHWSLWILAFAGLSLVSHARQSRCSRSSLWLRSQRSLVLALTMLGGFLPRISAESKAIVSRQAVGEPTVLERGPHHAEVEHITLDTAADGSTRQTTHRYVHLEVGMNRQLSDGTWQPVEGGLVLEPGRAVAHGTQHQVTFAANIRSPGAITLTLPDGRRLRSHPYGLAYTDAASGKSVLIAEVRDSVGVVDGDQVLYPDALDGLDADFRFTTTKSLFEQDVILREAPPSPKSYGLDPATTQLEVWTEFLEAPEPVREELRAGNLAKQTMKDESLGFGSMRMGNGRAFRLAESDETLAVVVKEWLVLADGRLRKLPHPRLQHPECRWTVISNRSAVGARGCGLVPRALRCAGQRGNGVSPVELTFEADFRGGATKGAGSASFRCGSVVSAVGILAGRSLWRWQRHAMGIVRGASWRVFEEGGFVGWEQRPFATFCDFCGHAHGIGPKGLTRRREDAKRA
jgi:hypothetical protein